MKSFITHKMNEIFYDFHRDLNRMKRFCVLKGLRFDKDPLPDYSIPVIQRLYLLRYFPGYLVEYYLMYKEMLKKDFLGDQLNIISIGSGCGIDFWGCKFANDELEKKKKIRYTGLDKVNWKYQDNLGIRECYFLHDDINRLNALDEDKYNVIVFPNSIGEFSNNTYANLEAIIKNTDFSCDRVMILSAIRKSRDTIDKARVAKIVTILETEYNYLCLDDESEYMIFEENEHDYHDRLGYICPHFIYPPEILGYLRNLNSKCTGYIGNCNRPHDNDCSQMDRNPILTTSQIMYQVLRFER
ncbi:MAG TPA: hypothetical protein DDZ89_13900 [Clostridiales bacterium]|nr:hypothetical protein [Clostridiales bacterium]